MSLTPFRLFLQFGMEPPWWNKSPLFLSSLRSLYLQPLQPSPAPHHLREVPRGFISLVVNIQAHFLRQYLLLAAYGRGKISETGDYMQQQDKYLFFIIYFSRVAACMAILLLPSERTRTHPRFLGAELLWHRRQWGIFNFISATFSLLLFFLHR